MFQRYNISQKNAWLGSILVLFVLLTGIVGYQLRTQTAQEIAAPVVSETILPEVEVATTVVAEVPEMTQEVVAEPTPMPEVDTPVSVDVASFLEADSPVVYPLEGEVISVFSISELTYNQTLGDWRIHDGVDIAAQQGTPVVASCSGTVVMAEDSDLLGTQVVIDHGNGYQTTYANLQTDPMVAEGDVVASGEIIGAVGTTALADSALEPHLHFSVSYNGDVIDPMVYLNDDVG
ncbi:M23 family metallopeptidase [Bengtsoniella intestinalis]|uniref:peptidoglycan DD-metalloendopeptidase family protein n=1 Tax=Bengtsoniella intestinalis TaxID=3073143 RepID=UPI00391F0DC3